MSAWYASVLAVCLLVYGAMMYLGLSGYLHRGLQRLLSRQSHMIGEKLAENATSGNGVESIHQISRELELTGLFVRISTASGDVLYRSTRLPLDHSFDPALVPSLSPVPTDERLRTVKGAGRSDLLIDALPVRLPNGSNVVVEIGSDMDEIARVLHVFALTLVLGIPLLVAIAIGGAIVITRNIMRPIITIADRAERVTSQNFGEPLPELHTGDELERLTVSLNRMVQRLAEVFRHIERFSADVSHELRTPLAILRGELELIQRARGIPPAIADQIGSSLEEIERLSRIVSQLLEISRLEAGHMQKDPLPVDVGALATATGEQMRLLADVKGIRVTYKVESGCFVEGSYGLLTQVIANLLDNAIKYTPPGGRIEVVVRHAGAGVRLQVVDNGKGIPARDVPRVFDRFYRADPARSQETAGTGLGLAIVKSICAAHGGSVSVDSQVDAGTSVTVEFPAAQTAPRPHLDAELDASAGATIRPR